MVGSSSWDYQKVCILCTLSKFQQNRPPTELNCPSGLSPCRSIRVPHFIDFQTLLYNQSQKCFGQTYSVFCLHRFVNLQPIRGVGPNLDPYPGPPDLQHVPDINEDTHSEFSINRGAFGKLLSAGREYHPAHGLGTSCHKLNVPGRLMNLKKVPTYLNVFFCIGAILWAGMADLTCSNKLRRGRYISYYDIAPRKESFWNQEGA